MRVALSLIMLASAAAAASAAGPTVEPPPGWSDTGAAGKKGLAVALKGPEKSSFLVKRVKGAPRDNPAAVRGYLQDVLRGLSSSTRRDYRSNGRIETRTFRNGLTAHLLRAQLGGEDRLVIGLFDADGAPHVGVLISAAPEAMLPSLFGELKYGKSAGDVQSSGVARSLDGQLELALGGGRRARSLGDTERAKGFVLAVQGAGSEVLFQKLADEDATKPSEQGAIARELAAASAGVPSDRSSPLKAAPTAAGPVAVYSWAASPDGVTRHAAGYLPWGYWGYQLFARGPAADDLLVGVAAALKAGPSAVPGLVAASPRIAVADDGAHRRTLALGGGLLLVLAAAAAVWSAKRKNATLPS